MEFSLDAGITFSERQKDSQNILPVDSLSFCGVLVQKVQELLYGIGRPRAANRQNKGTYHSTGHTVIHAPVNKDGGGGGGNSVYISTTTRMITW